MSRSRIFLRNVLRLSPSNSAALIWLPRVAASAPISSGILDLAQDAMIEAGRRQAVAEARENSDGR